MLKTELKRLRRERQAAGDYSGQSCREWISPIILLMPVGTQFTGADINAGLPKSLRGSYLDITNKIRDIPFVVRPAAGLYERIK